MDGLPINDDDVVKMDRQESLIGKELLMFAQLKQELTQRMSNSYGSPNWMQGGVTCEYLSTNGGGWRKGKLRLRLEFLPDEPLEQTKENASDL